eukprot:209273_1
MSASLERWYNYRCDLLFCGYARFIVHSDMIQDLIGLFIEYLYSPDGEIPNCDDVTHDVIFNKIEYLLLVNFFKSPKTMYRTISFSVSNSFVSISKYACLLPSNRWMVDDINDKKLLTTLIRCITCSKNCIVSNVFDDSALCQMYLNILINLSKNGVDLKYKFMKQLISMYECYYFDFYILRCIKKQNKKKIFIENFLPRFKIKSSSYNIGFNLKRWS